MYPWAAWRVPLKAAYLADQKAGWMEEWKEYLKAASSAVVMVASSGYVRAGYLAVRKVEKKVLLWELQMVEQKVVG